MVAFGFEYGKGNQTSRWPWSTGLRIHLCIQMTLSPKVLRGFHVLLASRCIRLNLDGYPTRAVYCIYIDESTFLFALTRLVADPFKTTV